jgi:hypothetical protein
MGGTYSTHGRNAYNILGGKPGGDYLEDLGVNGRIT